MSARLEFKNLVFTYIWVLTRVVRGSGRRIFWVASLDGLGTFSNAGMVAVLAFYINSVHDSGVIVVPIVDVEIKNGISALCALSLIILTLLVFSAWAIYHSVVLTRSIGRNAHSYVVQDVLSHFQEIRQSFPYKEIFTRQGVQLQIMRNALQIGIACETFTRAIQPAIAIIVYVGVAFYLDPVLSICLVPLAAMVFPSLWSLSSKIQSDAKEYYNSQAQNYGVSVNELIANLGGASLPAITKNQILDRFLATGKPKIFLDGFDLNQLANDKMAFVVSLFRALFFAIAIFVFGYYALDGEKPWGSMLAYMLVLMYTANGVQTLTSYLANLSRFYPQVADYTKFVAIPEVDDEARKGSLSDKTLSLTCADAVLSGGLSELQLYVGDCAYYNCGEMINRLNFMDKIIPLISASSISEDYWYQAEFVGSRRTYLPGSIRGNIFGEWLNNENKKESFVLDILEKTGYMGELNNYPHGLDTILTESTWNAFTPGFKSVLRILPLVYSKSQIIFVDNELLEVLTTVNRTSILEVLSDKIVFLMLAGCKVTGSEDRYPIVVAREERLLGIGDLNWYKNNISELGRYDKEKKDDIKIVQDEILIG